MEWFASKGAGIYFPIGHSPHCDFIAEFDDRLARVQVKSMHLLRTEKRWNVTVCTRGGNQSWNGLVKKLDAAVCDYLFVVVGDGRRWCIPSSALERGPWPASPSGDQSTAEFEVEPGRQLPARSRGNPPLQSAPPTLGGMSERPKEMDCKSIGSAYAGSNPAPPTTGPRAGNMPT